MVPHDLDWTGVPADRIAEIKRRIEILEACLILGKRAPAERNAAIEALGVRRAMFYRMLKIWRTSRKPADLPGVRVSERAGRGRSRLPKKVEAIIASAIQSLGPDAAPEQLVAEIRRRCSVASLKAPTRGTIRHRRRLAAAKRSQP